MAHVAPAEPLARPRRRFPQARARATYEALLAAAQEVFARKGFDETQSPDIAAEAGVSVGTFYRYFSDKRQAFVEMIGDHLAAAHADVMARLTPDRFRGSDRRAAIDTALDVLFQHMHRLPQLEAVYLAMSLRDPDVARLRAEFEALGCEALASLIALLIPKEVVPDPRAAAYVIHHATLEIAISRVVRAEPEFSVEDGAVRAALRELLHRYLFPEGATARGPRRRRRRAT
ncbi:MAG: TetR/AcrR family transcriptional regulator [Myxococcales bacterium]|nr:TetR/AcrR family transcriptional regulator [Myxococcales bacterium]